MVGRSESGLSRCWMGDPRSFIASWVGVDLAAVEMMRCMSWRVMFVDRIVMAYLRPYLLHMGKLVLILLFLLLLARRGDGASGAQVSVNVLLFLLGWLQDLRRKEKHRLGHVSRQDKGLCCGNSPGRSRANSRRHSSWHPHCRIHHSSWER